MNFYTCADPFHPLYRLNEADDQPQFPSQLWLQSITAIIFNGAERTTRGSLRPLEGINCWRGGNWQPGNDLHYGGWGGGTEISCWDVAAVALWWNRDSQAGTVFGVGDLNSPVKQSIVCISHSAPWWHGIPLPRLPVQLPQWRDSLRYSAELRQDAARSDHSYYFSSGVTLTW